MKYENVDIIMKSKYSHKHTYTTIPKWHPPMYHQFTSTWNTYESKAVSLFAQNNTKRY